MKDLLYINFKSLRGFNIKEILKVIILLFSLEIVLITLNIPLYINFMYCSLIYLYLRNLNGESLQIRETTTSIKHIFLNVAFVIVVAFFPNNNIVLIIALITLLIYTYLIKKEFNRRKKEGASSVYFDKSISYINLSIYVSLLFSYIIIWKIYDINYGTNFEFSYGLIFSQASILFIIISVITLVSINKLGVCKKNVIGERINEDVDENTTLLSIANEDIKFESDSLIQVKLKSFFENSNLYLNPNFTLSDLANHLNETKGVLSTVMNKDMDISFYTLMSIYRIKKAKEMLISQENITIESLALQCGFNSKSTFNKYFQIHVGLKPSEFRKLYLCNKEYL